MKKLNELRVGDKYHVIRNDGTYTTYEIVKIEKVPNTDSTLIFYYGEHSYQSTRVYFTYMEHSSDELGHLIIPEANSGLLQLYLRGFRNGHDDLQYRLQSLLGIEN